MAEGSDNLSNLEDDGSLFHEELAHVEELLISSREECIDIGSKYQNLSLQVENLLHIRGSPSPDSVASESFEDAKECRNDLEDHLHHRYETRIATYQQNQEHQARIVDDLQSRVEEYRMRCAKLEAALAEHSANEANITETDSQSQNALSMDLETALIRLEQEKNRCQGLTQINTLLREQLETATEVNQTLTSDIQRLTKEWQHARAQLLAKESEWKEEEQSFSLYFTKESNALLQMWRQVLNFRHDFANLRSHTERELSSFKLCVCNSLQNLEDVQAAIAGTSEGVGDTIDYTKAVINQSELEIPRLHDRISELIERNDRIQKLLDEKERANSALCSTVEKINDALSNSALKVQHSTKERNLESLCTQYYKAFEDLSQVLMADGSVEISSLFTVIPFTDFSSSSEDLNNSSSILMQLHSLVNAVRMSLQKYRKQSDENNLQIASLKDQTVMQERTVEFLEDERQKMQQLNSQLSLQFESVNQKMQSFLSELKTDSSVGSKQTAAQETVVRSLKDQVESLQTEREHLLSSQSELRLKLQTTNEEKRAARQSEQSLSSDLSRSTKKISEMEMRLETLRKDLQASQEKVNELTLDKELMEQEKKKFSSHLSNLETQCLDFQNCLRRLREEESLVKDSLSSVQQLSDGLCLEKADLSKALDTALDELEAARSAQSNAKIEYEKEKIELKLQIDKLQYKCLELEGERDKLQAQLQAMEESKRTEEDERSTIAIHNNDLTNQVMKFTAQQKNIESELEQVRAELLHQTELLTESHTKQSTLARSASELGIRVEASEEEVQRLGEVVAALEAEKAQLESVLYAAQQEAVKLKEEESDVARGQEAKLASFALLQAQLKDLQCVHEKCSEDATRDKDAHLLKTQQMEHEFRTLLENERHQHNVDIDLISEEKTALRARMVSAIDELYERQQQQQDELLSQHQEEVSLLKKQISAHEKDYEGKVLLLKEENKKMHNLYKEQISTLEQDIENLKAQLSDSEEWISELKEKMSASEKEHLASSQESAEDLKKLKDRMNTLTVEHSNVINNLENKIKDLKQEKESTQYEVQRMELQLNELDSERKKLVKELDERNIYYENERSSKGALEERLSRLQVQLGDEQSGREVERRSLEECRTRLRATHREKEEFKEEAEDARMKLNDNDTTVTRLQSLNAELKNTLREVEKSRQESKREAHTLKRSVSGLEKRLASREQELGELNTLHGREEEIQEELKKEIVQLKQKLMESSASREALTKELANSRQRSCDLEHQLRIHQEQNAGLLRECLSSEQSLSEQRLSLERSLAEAGRELHVLRTSLQSEEGKVLALESKVVKLDGTKREVETRLFSVCLLLRSILGLGSSDSGFLSTSRGNSSEKLADSRGSSPHRLNRSRTGGLPAQFCFSDLDMELLKTSLMDFVHRASATEKERDELKDVVHKVERELQNLRTEHNQCISIIFQLKRDLKDKKAAEKEFSTKLSSIHHYEEVIRTLEREKRQILEKVENAEFFSSSAIKEKENFKEKLSELKKNEVKLQEEISSLTLAKEAVEERAQKYVTAYQSLEGELAGIKETVAAKEQKLKTLEQKADSANKKVKSSESQAKSLKTTITHLKDLIEKQTQTEGLLNQKISQLNSSLSQSSSSHLNLNEEMERRQKESLKHQTELLKAQQENEQIKSSIDNFKQKNEALRHEVLDFKQSLQENEKSLQEHMEQIRELQNLLLTSRNLEKDGAEQLTRLQEQKRQLEERVRSLSNSLRSTKEQLGEKEELASTLEKECTSLRKSREKAERERSRSSEASVRSLMESSSLGTSLRQAETENETLQQKVQNLQAQLVELEERHSQRVRDFLANQGSASKTEETRLRSALRQAEQLMEAREKTHRQKVLGLEEQILVLKEGLQREQSRWKQYHQRSLSASANINYLHTVLGDSLRNASGDPQRLLLPEAERLDEATEMELSASRDISLTTPSKLRGRGQHLTSTPKSKRRLDNSKS